MDDEKKDEKPRIDAVAVIKGVEAGLFGWRIKEEEKVEKEEEKPE